MTPTEPEVVDSGRYSITEVGRHLKMDFKTVQKYTNEGALRCGTHKATKKKFYTGADIKKFWKAQY